MLNELLINITHNMFKPLLLFFYAGFAIPILRVKFEFPIALYQSITVYLLLSIGWHGGEELASLSPSMFGQALGFMLIGFTTNTMIGFATYGILRTCTALRKVDAATVSGYYGSDSAGTFLTCVGVVTAAQMIYAPYMPVMLAVMEIPGCLVALFLVSRLRNAGMDGQGNSVGESGYQPGGAITHVGHITGDSHRAPSEHSTGHLGDGPDSGEHDGLSADEQKEAEIALQSTEDESHHRPESHSVFSAAMLHEVFFNPGIFLLFAGIAIGFISRLQGERVIAAGDQLFVNLFQGILCLFLLEMGMTASKKLKDLRTAGWQFVAFALIAPNLFATLGMLIAHGYSLFLGQTFDVGTYVLFGVLCGSASYIALPAVQRMAIPEASPTLPLAASLGLTFSYNVTIGIPLYITIAKLIMTSSPIHA